MATQKACKKRELTRVAGYLSVREAALILEVSERSVYGYIDDGKLQAWILGTFVVLDEEQVQLYKRQPVGRRRRHESRWHTPARGNEMDITTITVRVCPGQGPRLTRLLMEMRQQDQSWVPGTTARYIARNQKDEEEIEIVLIWRSLGMPVSQEREAALAALLAEFTDLLDWTTAVQTDGKVLLHA